MINFCFSNDERCERLQIKSDDRDTHSSASLQQRHPSRLQPPYPTANCCRRRRRRRGAGASGSVVVVVSARNTRLLTSRHSWHRHSRTFPAPWRRDASAGARRRRSRSCFTRHGTREPPKMRVCQTRDSRMAWRPRVQLGAYGALNATSPSSSRAVIGRRGDRWPIGRSFAESRGKLKTLGWCYARRKVSAHIQMEHYSYIGRFARRRYASKDD